MYFYFTLLGCRMLYNGDQNRVFFKAYTVLSGTYSLYFKLKRFVIHYFGKVVLRTYLNYVNAQLKKNEKCITNYLFYTLTVP